MTPSDFFVKRAIVFSVLIVIGLGFFAYKAIFNSAQPIENSSQNITSNEHTITNPLPVFVWKFEEAKSLNPDGNPATNIYLEIQYSNGVEMRRFLIDTTPGSCSELPEKDTDSVSGSANIQCYYAGLGYRFKIVAGEKAYLVMRQEFEEGSPEYEPPVMKYEVVFEIPF